MLPRSGRDIDIPPIVGAAVPVRSGRDIDISPIVGAAVLPRSGRDIDIPPIVGAAVLPRSGIDIDPMAPTGGDVPIIGDVVDGVRFILIELPGSLPITGAKVAVVVRVGELVAAAGETVDDTTGAKVVVADVVFRVGELVADTGETVDTTGAKVVVVAADVRVGELVPIATGEIVDTTGAKVIGERVVTSFGGAVEGDCVKLIDIGDGGSVKLIDIDIDINFDGVGASVVSVVPVVGE